LTVHQNSRMYPRHKPSKLIPTNLKISSKRIQNYATDSPFLCSPSKNPIFPRKLKSKLKKSKRSWTTWAPKMKNRPMPQL